MYSPWQWQPLYIFPSDFGPEMASVWEGRWCRLCKMSEWQSVKPPGKPSRPRHETHFWIEKVWSVTHFFWFLLHFVPNDGGQAKRQMRSRSVKGTLGYLKSPSQSLHSKTTTSTYVPSRTKQIFYSRECQKKIHQWQDLCANPPGFLRSTSMTWGSRGVLGFGSMMNLVVIREIFCRQERRAK